jgi:uncharacterized protein (DUF58 family)
LSLSASPSPPIIARTRTASPAAVEPLQPFATQLRPGRRLPWLAGGLTVIGLLGFLWGAAFWVMCGLILLVAYLAYRDATQARQALNRVEVSRELPGLVGRNLAFVNRIRLRHSGPSPLTGEVRDVLPLLCEPRWCAQEFELPGLTAELHSTHHATESALGTESLPPRPPQEKSSAWMMETTCRIPVRGRFEFGPVWVRVSGAWGLMEAQREFACPGGIKVLPETFASREELQKDTGAQLLLLDKTLRSRQVGAGTEFVSLFPFRYGDDPRRIDWRATARQRYPIVRRYQVERHRDVLILIDSGRLMGTVTERGTKLDCAVDAALNLSRVALHSGDRCGIGVFDSELRGYLAPLAGPRSLPRLVDSVYDLQPTWRETDFTTMFAEIRQRQSKRCLLVILSDLGDAESSRMHCAALARLSRQHLVLFAALKTPLLRKVIHAEPQSIAEGARQAVAHGLLRDRGRTLHQLERGGIHVVDVEPRQLTLPLINQFIELRQRNLL